MRARGGGDRGRAQQDRRHRIEPQHAGGDHEQATAHEDEAILADPKRAELDDQRPATHRRGNRRDILDEQIEPEPGPRDPELLGDPVGQERHDDLTDIGQGLLQQH